MAYNKYDDLFTTGATVEEIAEQAKLHTAQTVINQMFVTDKYIGNMTMAFLLDTLHSLPAVIAYARPEQAGLEFRKYVIHYAINKEIQAYISRNY